MEPFLGVGCYMMGIPMLAVGFILTLLLIRLEAVLKTALAVIPLHPKNADAPDCRCDCPS